MNRSFINILFLILVLVSSQLILFSCAGPQEIPESERKYIEGVVVEGGIHGFRMRDENGNIIRFAARDDVEYQPPEFHAYYGDRIGVTYHAVIKRDKDWYDALRVVLLTTNPNRIDFGYGAVDGIIRARGMMRYLVYLPENDLTVAFYKKQEVKYSPKNWIPKKGNKVKVYFSEDSGRFFKKLKCIRISLLEDDPVSIQDKMETGVITEIYVLRGVKRAPDRFAFQLKNGDTWTMYGGGETKLVPKGIKVKTGNSYSIEYYRLVMGDQSLRYVAAKIEAEDLFLRETPKIRLEKKKKSIAYVPKVAHVLPLSLRNQPVNNLTPTELKEFIRNYGFFDKSTNKHGSFKNEFVDNGNSTVTDRATGLMWQKGGSEKSYGNRSAYKYIKKLNESQFAGYSDWRVPTVEELVSLLEKDKINGVHIDSVFDNQQIRCWSIDGTETMHGHSNATTAWVLDYKYGKARRAHWYSRHAPSWVEGHILLPDNYVRAVRSIK